MLKTRQQNAAQDEREAEVTADYEARIAKMTKEHNEEVNELEQKLQYERIGVQTIKNAERTEMQELRKEATDLKFQLRQAEM